MRALQQQAIHYVTIILEITQFLYISDNLHNIQRERRVPVHLHCTAAEVGEVLRTNTLQVAYVTSVTCPWRRFHHLW
jgi:hypothetical protein